MLLPTKLSAPRSPGALVARPRLVERIEENLSHRLTLISAPAGSGKSTVLGQWMRTTEARTAWLSLDPADDDPRRFSSYVIAALSSISPQLSADAPDLLSAASRVDLIGLFTRAAILPFAQCEQRAALVLDDYHLIRRPEIHEAIAWLIDQLPPHLHLMIASRTAPPFSLSRWRVRRELLEIGPLELRFSREEATEFYNQVMSLSLSPADVAAIEERTEGWAAALQLSALSLKGGTDARALVRALSGEHRLIAEYLAEEVLDQQPEDRRRFLLSTSILERMSAPLCEAVTGEPGAQEHLRALEEANLFLFPLDESGEWFRYHHLFAELLKKRMAAEQDAAVLHQRAADWFASHGRFDEAVRHLMIGGPTAFAEERLELWGEALIKAGEVELLRRWTASFPETARSPFLGVHAAWAAVLSGRAEEVELWAARSERNLPPPGETRAKVEQNLAASRAFAAQTLGSLARSVELSEVTLAGPLNPEIQAALQLNAGQALRHMGEFERALGFLADASRGGLDTGHLYLAFGALFHRAACLRVLGRLQSALRIIDDLENLRSQERRGGHLAVAGGEVERAYIGWLQGDQERALGLVRSVIAEVDIVTEPWDVAYVRSILARVLVSAGELDEADLVLDETRLPSRARERCMVEFAMVTAQAELALARGDPDRARSLLRPGDAPDAENAFERRWIEARVAFAKGEPIDRAAATSRAEEEARGRLMHASAWAALLAASRRDPTSLADARRLAELTGIERWCMMFDLSQPTPQPVRRAQVEPLIETLTQRELEVLGLIAEGLSNQDAASKLFVSVGTVKTHVHKILAKLAADNRTEAVHKARSLGLIR